MYISLGILGFGQIILFGFQLERSGDRALEVALTSVATVGLLGIVFVAVAHLLAGSARRRWTELSTRGAVADVVLGIILDKIVRWDLAPRLLDPAHRLPMMSALVADAVGVSIWGGGKTPIRMCEVEWANVISMSTAEVRLSGGIGHGIRIEVDGAQEPYRIEFGLGRHGRPAILTATASQAHACLDRLIVRAEQGGWRARDARASLM